MKGNWFYIALFFCATSLFAQNDSLTIKKNNQLVVVKDSIQEEAYNPLAPSKAAFYSAVIPGLGQIYNKKYWKVPIIYGGMAVGVLFYLDADKDYNRFRDAYKSRLAGFTNDEFYGEGATPRISNARLIDAQRSAQKNKDYSAIAVLVVYMLNIIDANVDAHLQQYNINEDLSVSPKIDANNFNIQPNYGLTLRYTIK